MAKFRIENLFLGVLLSICMLGCKSPNPNPETLDPIYADLLKESEAASKETESLKGEIEKLEQEIPAFEARDPGKKRAERELYQKEHLAELSSQRALFYKIQADMRLKYARREYLKAFNADKPWPNPKEYEEYLENKKLRSASRNWDDRVPKTTRYNRSVPGSAAEGKKEAKSGEGKPAAHE